MLVPVVITGGVGLVGGYVLANWRKQTELRSAGKRATLILNDAKGEAQELREETAQVRHQMEVRLHERELEQKERLEMTSRRLDILQKQAQKWDHRVELLQKRRLELAGSIESVDTQLAGIGTEQIKRLVEKTGQQQETVVQQLQDKYLADFQMDFEKYQQKLEHFTKEDAPKTARKLLTGIMNRYSEPSSVERFNNTITIKQDKAKGRLIGKAGKNINYFEEQAQVAVIFNDQGPNQITVSSFHLLRREIAKLALQNLIKKPVIDEKIIDKALTEARMEIDKILEKLGRWAADIIDLPTDKRDPELLRLMGRLKYRTSYGQNILYHSLEIAFFSAMMAAEIGADIEVARLGGFFHDLGKAIDQDDDVDKPHDHLSKEILERFGFSWEIVHAAWTHHDAIPIETVEAEIVKAADAISAGRPGARSESAEDYYARIAALEEMAMKQPGADKVFAMSAGRELRLFLNPEAIKDEEMPKIAADLAHEIEENLSYPGKIRVNLVRSLEIRTRTQQKHR